ncbi:MAG: ABC transporter permease [Spirochaetaceae bacterium]
MILTRIAVLNIRTHPRRTLLIVFAIMLSVVVMLFVEGMLDGMRRTFFQRTLRDTGHIQLHDAGWEDRINQYSLDHTIRDPEAPLSELRARDDVLHAEKFLLFGGMLIGEEKNLAAGGVGVSPDTAFYTTVKEGMARGSLPSEPTEIAVSARTAELLDVSFGDPLVVLVEDSRGSPYYIEYETAGLFESDSSQFDTSFFFVTHAAAAELLYLEGRTTEIRVNLTGPEIADEVAAELESRWAEREVSVQTWRDIHGSFVVIFELFDVFMLFIDLLVIIVAASVITNAVLMNVFDRTREFGTMRAIGLKKRAQLGLIVTEGVSYGVLGTVAGIAAGAPLVLYFAEHGLYMGAAGEAFEMGRRMYFSLTAANLARSSAAGVLTAVIGSLYAGVVLGRRRIVELFQEAH